MLKKFLIGTIAVFALAFALTVSAAVDLGPTTLKVGSSGPYVMTLQGVVGATQDGNFGPMTKAKVMAWQASNGLVADGIVGPATKNAMNAGSYSGSTTDIPGCPAGASFNTMTGAPCGSAVTLPAGCTSTAGFSPVTGVACSTVVTPATLPAGCTSTVGYSVTTGMSCSSQVQTGTLAGGAGSMTAIETSTDVETNLVEGVEDQKILGFKVTADGSDVKVTNVKITLTKGGTGSSYLDRYVEDVSVWMGDDKIATVDADEFTKDSTGVYSKSVALNNSIVKMGTSNKETFYITVSGISNIDSGLDMGATWTVNADNFRYQDATGVILTYNPTVALNSAALDVTDIASAGDVKLAVSRDSSSPTANTVTVSDTGSTDVTMLVFRMKNTGAEMTFDTLDFSLTGVIAGLNDLQDVVGELIIKEGSSVLGSTSTFAAADTDAAVTIDLDDTYTIDADSTATFTVVAKINDIDNFAEGDSLQVDYVADSANLEIASTRTAFTGETGSANGEVQTFSLSKSSVTSVTTSSSVANNTTKPGYISFAFTVSADEGDVVLDATPNNDANITWTPTGTDITLAGLAAPVLSKTSGTATLAGGNYTILEGDSATFVLDFTFTPVDAGDNGIYRITLNQVAGVTLDKLSGSVNLAF